MLVLVGRTYLVDTLRVNGLGNADVVLTRGLLSGLEMTGKDGVAANDVALISPDRTTSQVIPNACIL